MGFTTNIEHMQERMMAETERAAIDICMDELSGDRYTNSKFKFRLVADTIHPPCS